ncbi:MAG: sugar phosphate isomerase/epimerase [Gemmatimonadetes bacterium]|nr:MAG: sugar phosphate isomerase/epimerase [Gemmatimonadota bacterium]PYP49953.1 MAG: sugar phosphate isomerase/epimerase [Gemmatimonadota bacterium]
MQTRRNFIATLGVAALGIASREAMASSEILAPRRKLKRIGLQLYTVRDLMKTDLPGTLSKVAAIGYKEVEFAGYFGRTPVQIRELLRRDGLSSPSTHLPFESLESGWQKQLDDAKGIGHHWATIAWIPEDKRKTLDDWKRHADSFNKAGAQAKAAGMRFAYHNHDFELRSVDGQRPLDILLTSTDPSLVDFEMDLYWVKFGGGDPLDFFNRYPKRFAMVHVKDSSGPPDNRMVDVGQGTIDFRSIFAQSQKAGIKHYFVEHDQPADPIATIRNSYNYLHRLTF